MNIQDIQHVLNNAALHQRNERPNHANLCNQAAVAVGEIGKQRDALLAACQKVIEGLSCQVVEGCTCWSCTTWSELSEVIALATGNQIDKPQVSGNLNQPLERQGNFVRMIASSVKVSESEQPGSNHAPEQAI